VGRAGGVVSALGVSEDRRGGHDWRLILALFVFLRKLAPALTLTLTLTLTLLKALTTAH
jgi:hypothetical protein